MSSSLGEISSILDRCESRTHPTYGESRLWCKWERDLQVEVNVTNSAFLQNDHAVNGKPVVMRQAVNDARGHVSEMLMKCVGQGALDTELSKDDKDRMLSFLRTYGELDEAGKYNGCDRAGYSQLAGAGDVAGVLSAPIDMHTLLQAEFWQGMMFDQAFECRQPCFSP